MTDRFSVSADAVFSVSRRGGAGMTELKTFLDVPSDHDFSIYNLPYGIFSTPHTEPRVGVAIGDYVLDLSVLADAQLFRYG